MHIYNKKLIDFLHCNFLHIYLGWIVGRVPLGAVETPFVLARTSISTGMIGQNTYIILKYLEWNTSIRTASNWSICSWRDGKRLDDPFFHLYTYVFFPMTVAKSFANLSRAAEDLIIWCSRSTLAVKPCRLQVKPAGSVTRERANLQEMMIQQYPEYM